MSQRNSNSRRRGIVSLQARLLAGLMLAGMLLAQLWPGRSAGAQIFRSKAGGA